MREKVTKGEAAMLAFKNEFITHTQSTAARGGADGFAKDIEMETDH